MQENFTEFAARLTGPGQMLAQQVFSNGPGRSAGQHAGQYDSQTATLESVVATLLDALDYGVVLLRDGAQVVHLNRAARDWLRSGHGLDLCDGALRARHPADGAVLIEALAAARRGLRRLVTLGVEHERVSVAVTPIDSVAGGGQPMSVLVVGRSRLCEPISVQWFARTHGLTPAESTVLELLSVGLGPAEIAQANTVGMATVRTQIKCIRDKTRAASIRDLMRLLALLPPVCSSLRC